MNFYGAPSNEVEKKLKDELGNKEKFEISRAVKFDGKIYREIRLAKNKGFGLKKPEYSYAYIDSNDYILRDEKRKKEVARQFYYATSFFDESAKNSLKLALQQQGDLNRDRKDYQYAEEGIAMLSESGMKQAEMVKTVSRKVINLREKTNFLIEDILELGKENYQKLGYYDEETIDGAKALYRDLMSVNFEKVLVIVKGYNIYDEVQKKALKMKKKLNIRFSSDKVMPLAKLDYVISYYKRIMRTYETVLNLNMRQYMKQYERVEEGNISQRLSKLKKTV